MVVNRAGVDRGSLFGLPKNWLRSRAGKSSEYFLIQRLVGRHRGDMLESARWSTRCPSARDAQSPLAPAEIAAARSAARQSARAPRPSDPASPRADPTPCRVRRALEPGGGDLGRARGRWRARLVPPAAAAD